MRWRQSWGFVGLVAGAVERVDNPPAVRYRHLWHKLQQTLESTKIPFSQLTWRRVSRQAVHTTAHAPRSSGGFPVSEHSAEFYRRFFPGTPRRNWGDWRWQLQNCIRTLPDLDRLVELSADEHAAVLNHRGSLPFAITPHLASIISHRDPFQPLRRTLIPVTGEHRRTSGETDDPLGEDRCTPVPGLVHRYPDRVLLLTIGTCAAYCRYCTRSRLVGQSGSEATFSARRLDQAIAYIQARDEIRDVLVSGGDPLIMADEQLNNLLGRLRAIPHVELIRIGTKVPVALPMRVTAGLVSVLKRHGAPWLSIHVTHPTELTPESTEALARLADAGIPLGSQTVLLRGINDSVATMKSLMRGLVQRRVKPYYLYQCDPITGSAHFRTPVAKGLEIIEGLQGHTTGYAVPQYVIDAPGGGGKIPLVPDYVVCRDQDDLLLRNFEGGIYRYHDPQAREG
ncbi:KamA family radical SAM protein [Thiococcus pfennigii]|uniref:KamA family radical SAM protein n=1 Tax=Thiococcus pfennigii TaxID=1057 RepID=UPI001902D706|nr:KamA family radical SAM protein [Thiococcus pfennigii]MBK1700188.1 lysine 2,3-aminomutase [Thiococcus pfennigii]